MELIIGPIITALCLFQILQWLGVLTSLFERKYDTKVEFLLKLIPGYFIIYAIKGCCKLFNHFMLLK
jgi:hypothetical protein